MNHTKRKISILGTGNVGATIAYTLALTDICSEILLVDINRDKAEGEMLDISQCSACTPSVSVRCGEYEDVKGSDIVIVTFGVGRKPGQTRIDLAKTNVAIIKSIAKDISKVCPNAVYIIVANPVDILTHAFIKATNIPASRVIGSGTSLDTARLKAKLAQVFKINVAQIHANCFGEHGDTQFIPWSLVKIGGVHVDDYVNSMTTKYTELEEFDKDAVLDYVKKSGGVIIQNKGATYNGVAAAVVHICKNILSGIDSIMCLSTLLNGEYGAYDICLSTLVVVGRDGVKTTLTPPLTKEEQEKFLLSAQAMKKVIEEIEE